MNELANPNMLFAEGNELVSKIVEEKDPEKIKELETMFDLNMRKKNMARMNKLSNLLDCVDDEAIMRFSSTPEDFDNDQLLRYMDSTQKAINGITQTMNQQPAIQINTQNNEFNLNSGLNVDSRKKVLDAVIAALNTAKSIEEEEDA